MSLTHVVEQGGHHHLVVSPGGDHGEGAVIGVPLVGDVLGEEQVCQLRRQPDADGFDLRPREGG